MLEKQLEGKDYLLGEYTIADMATFPWVNGYSWAGLNIDHLPNVKRWLDVMNARPAVAKGLTIPPRTFTESQQLQAAQNILV